MEIIIYGGGATLNNMDAVKKITKLKGFPSYHKGIHSKGGFEIKGRIIYGMEIFE